MKLNSGSLIVECLIALLITSLVMKVLIEIVNLDVLYHKLEVKYEERI